MEPRKLKTKDLYTAGAMFRKVAPVLSSLSLTRENTEDEKAHTQRVGRQIIQALLDECYDDAWAWLADLAGMTVEEFNDQPFEAPFEIIELLIEQEDLKAFTERVSRMIKKD